MRFLRFAVLALLTSLGALCGGTALADQAQPTGPVRLSATEARAVQIAAVSTVGDASPARRGRAASSTRPEGSLR